MDNENIIPLVALIMGSQSDWETMKFSENTLLTLKIPFITKIISAHRTPERMYKFASESENNKIQMIQELAKKCFASTKNNIIRDNLFIPYKLKRRLSILN